MYRPAEIFNDELLKDWQGEYRARMKRKAEGSEQDGRGSKKIIMANGPIMPVNPEDYWPASQDNGEDDFEDDTKTLPKEVKKDTESSTEAELKHENTKEANNADSDTEEEEEISLAVPPQATKKATSSSPAKDARASSPLKKDSEKHSSSPETVDTSSTAKLTSKSMNGTSPMKQTVVPVKALASTKRDRFGRSDF